MTTLDTEYVRNLVRAALAEDIGGGDITTEAAIPADERAEGYIVAKEPCVVAGLPLVEAVFTQDDLVGAIPRGRPGQARGPAPTHVTVKLLAAEGDKVESGDRVCRLAGSARAILTGERTALNFLQRLSGIATLTRQFVDAVAVCSRESHSRPTILDTRKTTPTLRMLEKYAVAVGGGENHRLGLFDAVMIKDNHRAILNRLGLKALGDAVATARKNHPHAPIILEADTLEQVEEALAVGANHILLDNMTPDELREAVKLVAGRAKTEASGGISLANVAAIAATGVDYISVGALTHSARAVDFSLEIRGEEVG